MKVLRALGAERSPAGRHRAVGRRRTSRPAEVTPESHSTDPGRLLNGRYELLEVIGRGGMGTVHRAHDRVLDRQVAVKVLRPGAPDLVRQQRRLAAEATIGAALDHDGVTQVFEVGEVRTSFDRTSFLVMELIEGVTLASMLDDRGRLTVEETLALVRSVALILAHLAENDVVHRDVKPANIMLTPEGRVVLVDLGIARGPSSQAMTTTGTLLGTADFLSPEQILGRTATSASDLYALGLVAHLCVSGAPVFRRETTIASAYAQVHEPLPPLPAHVPEPLRDLVTRLASKVPSDRPTAADVVRVVDAIAPAARLPHVGATVLQLPIDARAAAA